MLEAGDFRDPLLGLSDPHVNHGLDLEAVTPAVSHGGGMRVGQREGVQAFPAKGVEAVAEIRIAGAEQQVGGAIEEFVPHVV